MRGPRARDCLFLPSTRNARREVHIQKATRPSSAVGIGKQMAVIVLPGGSGSLRIWPPSMRPYCFLKTCWFGAFTHARTLRSRSPRISYLKARASAPGRPFPIPGSPMTENLPYAARRTRSCSPAQQAFGQFGLLHSRLRRQRCRDADIPPTLAISLSLERRPIWTPKSTRQP